MIAEEFCGKEDLKINLKAELVDVQISPVHSRCSGDVGVHVIEHDAGVRVQIPVEAGGDVLLLPSGDAAVIEVDGGKP